MFRFVKNIIYYYDGHFSCAPANSHSCCHNNKLYFDGFYLPSFVQTSSSCAPANSRCYNWRYNNNKLYYDGVHSCSHTSRECCPSASLHSQWSKPADGPQVCL